MVWKRFKRKLDSWAYVLARALAAVRRYTLRRLRHLGFSHPSVGLKFIRMVRLFAPNQQLLALLDGLFTARSVGWDAATPRFLAIAVKAEPRPAKWGASGSWLLAPVYPTPGVNLAIPVSNRHARLSRQIAERIVVYTASFGVHPHLPPIFGQPKGLRFICFTDQPITSYGWEIVLTETHGQASEFHQICPHRLFKGIAPTAKWSLYLDPDILIVGNLHTLLTRWLTPSPFVLWRHPYCIDWPDLIERHLLVGTAPVGSLLVQAQACETNRLGRNRGCGSTAVIWRRHDQAEITAFMDAWWDLQKYSCAPSDVTLYRILHGAQDPQCIPAIMPSVFGSAEHNIFFIKDIMRAVPRKPGNVGSAQSRRIPIIFLCPEDRRDRVTAILRGAQLSEIIRAHFSDIYDSSFTSDFKSARNGVVILTPYALNRYDVETLSEIKSRNLVLIGSWEDGIPQKEKVQMLDAHMTLSLPQKVALGKDYPEVPAFHVTHHVNRMIPRTRPPADQIRTGYFGDLRNTVRPNSLSEAITLVDTLNTPAAWLRALPGFNCHWIIRSQRRGFGWKPFLKGFLAARCGAVVIVTRDDVNAEHYLGDDYPFYAQSLSEADLEMAWAYAASTFGGREWGLAQEIMRQVEDRSSDAQVCVEFKAMVDAVLS